MQKEKSYQMHNLVVEILQAMKAVHIVIDSCHSSQSYNSNNRELG
jgi:hypothetical protein